MARESFTASCSASTRTASSRMVLASSALIPETRSRAMTWSCVARARSSLALSISRSRSPISLFEHLGPLIELLVPLDQSTFLGAQLVAARPRLFLGLACRRASRPSLRG